MSRSERRPEKRRRSLLARSALATTAALAANPVAVGGATAFLVALAFVSANALWYQPHRHPGAFVSTRLPGAETLAPGASRATPGETTIRIEREADAAPKPVSDPVLMKVQQALAGLNLYAGAVDGLHGPRTRKAIETYQTIAGLEPTGDYDPALLKRLGISQPRMAEATRPEPRAASGIEAIIEDTALEDGAVSVVPTPRGESDQTTTASVAPPDPVIVQIQAGLRAFGNDDVELDGVAGQRTRAAIREFQSLFGLEATGEPGPALLAKMKDVGLVN